MSEAREVVMAGIKASLARTPAPASAARPPIVGPRQEGTPGDEMEQLLGEIRKLSGVTRRLAGKAEIAGALADLIATEGVTRATLWPEPGLAETGIAQALGQLGVQLVSPFAGKQELARCDLGVTGVDMALPETGTLVLKSDETRPRMVSLVPRVHLAILRPAALRADLHQAFADGKCQRYLIFITGPSRTADIELTLTIGVHGPKALYVWVLP